VSSKLPHLRFAADRRTLAFVAAYFAMFFGFWSLAPRGSSARLAVLLVGLVVLGPMSWFCAVITHNVVHCPVFKERWANRVLQVLLSLSYGFAISDYVPGHNLSHHRYMQTRRDVMRTTKVRFPINALNFFAFFPTVAPAIIASNGRYLKSPAAQNEGYRRQRTLEVIIVWTVKAFFLWLDWERFLFLLLLPHLWAVWGVTSVNFIQHDGCDPDHPVNHSRNFVGKLFNWVHFNNGYHGMHHEEPGLHWSLLPEAHARLLHPTIHPALEQKSLALYLVRMLVLPGKRVTYDGKPVVVPATRERDEEWISMPTADKPTA
jgi:fatty acid desaturase